VNLVARYAVMMGAVSALYLVAAVLVAVLGSGLSYQVLLAAVLGIASLGSGSVSALFWRHRNRPPQP
jgi:hypothetical protein